MPEKPLHDNPFNFKIEYDADFILERYRISNEAADQIDEIFHELFKGKKSTIKRLHRLCKKYPHIPQFKNYLSIAYDNAGNQKKAVEVNDEILQKHPGYLFGKIHKAEILIGDNKLNEVPELLGDELHIHKLFPDRNTFHIGEVSKYYSIAVQYLLKRNRVNEAKLRLDYLSEIEPDSPETELAWFAFMQYNLEKNMQRLKKDERKERRVQSRGYSEDLQTDQSPTFTHPEIEELYKHGLDIPEKIIQSILELPRKTLITDLEHVLEDAIYRYEYFYDEATEEHDGWNEERYNFSVHAILLLAELRSERSLKKILDLLRQGDEFREFWYNNLLEDIFSESVAILASEKLETLTNFVKEPDLDAYCRNVGVSALEIIAIFYPDRRNEVVEIFNDLIQFHLNQLDNDRIIDTTLLSFLVWSCVNISAEELLPSIRKLYEHDLIYETMVGDIMDVEQDIKGDMVDRNLHPETIFERYESLTTDPIMSNFPLPENSPDNAGALDLFSEFLEDDPIDHSKPLPFEPNLKAATNPYKNVGRNDPCPCGSGKKYKKCCL